MIDQILSEVLNLSVIDVNSGIQKGTKEENCIYYRVENDYGNLHMINKYEFMHKCKEYIWDNGYAISISEYIGWEDEKQGTLLLKEKDKSCENMSVYDLPLYQKFTEFKAVIQATTWVISKKENS